MYIYICVRKDLSRKLYKSISAYLINKMLTLSSRPDLLNLQVHAVSQSRVCIQKTVETVSLFSSARAVKEPLAARGSVLKHRAVQYRARDTYCTRLAEYYFCITDTDEAF